MKLSTETKLFFFFFLFLFQNNVFAQIKKNTVRKDTPVYYQHINNYFKFNPAQTSSDSVEQAAYNYIFKFNTNDSLIEKVHEIQELISENKAFHQIPYLLNFRNKIDSLNQIRNHFMQDYWDHQRLLNMADTSDIASEDSLFNDILDAVFYQDTLNIDSIFKALSPYNDSLIASIDQVIYETRKNEIIQWINFMRSDTANFYVVDLEGDSMLVRLYDDSPEMIKLSITDYWGKTTSAVIRDIERNSFRILVDNAPELTYETDEKARQALGGMRKINRIKKQLTIMPIPIEKDAYQWIYGGNVAVDLSQISLSNSWVKGGASALSFMTGLELFANFKKDNYSWENKGIFRYGAQRQDNYQDFRPTEDRLELYTKYGHKLYGNYYISILSDIKTQFANGWEYQDTIKNLVSQFMSPGYITFALGLDYKPNKRTTVFFSPITSKSTFVLNNAIDKTKYGVDTTRNARHETGAIFKATFKNKVWDNIEMENHIELFSNYIDKPQNVDIDWDLKVIMPVNDFIRATVSTKLIYDDNQLVPKDRNNADKGTTKAIQFKELLTIGFAMKF